MSVGQAPPERVNATANATRWTALPDWLARRPRYTLPGSWTALVFAALSFTPSLMPRPALFQGLVTGISAAIGYGFGVLGAFIWREFADRDSRAPRGSVWRLFLIIAAAVLVTSIAIGAWWQRSAAPLVGLPPESLLALLVIPPVAALSFAVFVGIGRLLVTTVLRPSHWLSQHMGARAARALGAILVIAVGALLLNGVLANIVVGAVNSTFSLGDTGTPDGVSSPATSDRSGGPGSLVPWDTLGLQGRVFVALGPNAASISDAMAVPAQNPIRAYAGLISADDIEERARLAVRDLERAGGFQRKNLLVVTSTGSGWVEPSSVSAFEYLSGGDSATVSMQYSFLSSPLSFLADQQDARDAGRALFDAVYVRWRALPEDERPKLYAFGESLGSFGGEAAFSGEFDMANRISGAVFTGAPNFNPLYRSFVDGRDPGSPEIEPVYRNGRIVRFTTSPSQPIPPVGKPWDGPRVLYLQHASDPFTWWSTDLILHRPDWLTEPRGRDVLDATRWVPFVTFWQITTDMPLSLEPAPGHGHNFSGEHVDAWAAVLRTPDWDAQKAAQLKGIVRAQLTAPYLATPGK